MKKGWLIAIFPLLWIVSACTTTGKTGEEEMQLNPGFLEAYYWQLTEAETSGGERIDSLFVAERDSIQISFMTDQRVSVSNACNSLFGGYRIEKAKIIFGHMASTMKLCSDPSVNQLDSAVSSRLQGEVGYTLTQQGGYPQLLLTTSSGDRLTFKGVPTAEKLYGSAGEIIFIEVAPEKVSCQNAAADNQCLQVRELRYNGPGEKIQPAKEFSVFPHEIQGYQHRPGERNVVRVKRYPVKTGQKGEFVFILDMVVESEIVPAKGN